MPLSDHEIERVANQVLVAIGKEMPLPSGFLSRRVESHALAEVKAQTRSLARFIDHTLLKPEATEEQIRRLCQEAREYRFATVCVTPLSRSVLWSASPSAQRCQR